MLHPRTTAGLPCKRPQNVALYRVNILLSADADVNAGPSYSGRTALQAAAEGGHVDVVLMLLQAKADVNAAPAPERGRTALQAAAEGGYTIVFKWRE
jgi:ankyrin repeat protein